MPGTSCEQVETLAKRKMIQIQLRVQAGKLIRSFGNKRDMAPMTVGHAYINIIARPTARLHQDADAGVANCWQVPPSIVTPQDASDLATETSQFANVFSFASPARLSLMHSR